MIENIVFLIIFSGN